MRYLFALSIGAGLALGASSAAAATFTLDQPTFDTATSSLAFTVNDDFSGVASGDAAGPIVRDDFTADAAPGVLRGAFSDSTGASGAHITPHIFNASTPNELTLTFNQPINALSFNFDGNGSFSNDVVTVTVGADSFVLDGSVVGTSDIFVGIYDLATPFSTVSFAFTTRNGNGTYGIDDIAAASSVAAVPTLSALPLALTGLGAAGMVARRRRT